MEKSVTQLLQSRSAVSRMISHMSDLSKSALQGQSTINELGVGTASKHQLTEKQRQEILEGKMKTDFESVITPEEKAAKKAAKKKNKKNAKKKEKDKKEKSITLIVPEKEVVNDVPVDSKVAVTEVVEEIKEEEKKSKTEKVKKEKKEKVKKEKVKEETTEEKKPKKTKKPKDASETTDTKESKGTKKSKKKGKKELTDAMLKSIEQFQGQEEFASAQKLISKDNLKSKSKLSSEHKIKSNVTLKHKESQIDQSESKIRARPSEMEPSRVSFKVSKKKGKKEKKEEKESKSRSKLTSMAGEISKSEVSLKGRPQGGSFFRLKSKHHKSKSGIDTGSVDTFLDDSTTSTDTGEVATKKTKSKKKLKKDEKKKKSKKKEEDDDTKEKSETEGSKKSKKKVGKKEAAESVTTKSEVTSAPESVAEGVKKGKKKKKGKRKKAVEKLDPKQRARQEEEKRLQAEAEAIKQAELDRLRHIEERKMGIAKAKRDALEQQWRIEQLANSAEFIENIIEAGHAAYAADKVLEDWEEYLCCDGLPKPWNPAEMNTYLHLWDKEIETVTADQAVKRTDEIVKLLDDLDTLISDPFDHSLSRQADWKWIRTEFRNHQKENLNYATYRLLRYISDRMNRITIPTADFRLGEKNFSLCLWTLVKLPTPTPNPRIPGRPRLQVQWPEMNVEILFPNSLHFNNLAVRGIYVKYDHLSDTCESYNAPPPPDFYSKDLREVTAQEWYTIMRYKYDQRVIVKKDPVEVVLEDGTITYVDPDPEPELAPDEMPPTVPFQLLEPTASVYALNLEKEEFDKKCIQIAVPDQILNMRKFQIIGGVYHLDLFVQPPQPQEMVSFEVFVSTLMIPCSLAEAHFYVGYVPPPPTEPGVRKEPEEIEEEMIRMERELDELIFIHLVLPEHVFWFEAPIVCQWDKDLNGWSTADIFDFKYFEEKGYLTFRTGKFGPFALAVYRYSNLPFQAWEIRPESDGSVTFQLTAAILVIEFTVKGYLVCVSQIQNEPNNAMKAHIGIYYKLPKLITILRNFGVDIFPDPDTFFYVEGTCEKHWPMEKQIYYGLALGSIAYNFSWSRWNITLDYRSIVFQMRMYKFNKPKQLSFSMCLVTPIKAVMVDCSEVSPTFNEEPVEGSKFYADFLCFIKGVSNMATKNKLQAAPMETMNTLANLFQATRFLSFS